MFSPKQPELNWENPEVRAEVHRMMNWWLDRGVDGFRMDVINLLSKRVVPGTPGLLDGEAGDATAFGNGWPQVVNGPRIHEFLQEMHRAVFAGRPPGLLTVGETPATSVEEARLYSDAARAELDMVFQFEHVDLDAGPDGRWDVVPFGLVDLKRAMARWQDGLAELGWNSLYWGNHDTPRAVSRFGNDSPEHRAASAKALATVLHLHRGTPYVYQGDELGMTNGVFERVEDFRDLDSLNQYQEGIGRGLDHDRVMSGLAAQEPRQRPDAHAVGRRRARRLHHRYAVAARQPQPHRDQRRRPGRRP